MSGMNGKFYHSVKYLSQTPAACVFSSPFGVQQGGREGMLSPAQFSIYINKLILEIKQASVGVG